MPSQRLLCFETGGQNFFLDFIVKEIIPVWWHVTGLALELQRRRYFCHYVFKKGFKVQSINPYASKATPSPRASQCTRQGLMALSTPPTWLAADLSLAISTVYKWWYTKQSAPGMILASFCLAPSPLSPGLGFVCVILRLHSYKFLDSLKTWTFQCLSPLISSDLRPFPCQSPGNTTTLEDNIRHVSSGTHSL